MTIIYFLFIISLLLYIIKDKNTIQGIVHKILKYKLNMENTGKNKNVTKINIKERMILMTTQKGNIKTENNMVNNKNKNSNNKKQINKKKEINKNSQSNKKINNIKNKKSEPPKKNKNRQKKSNVISETRTVKSNSSIKETNKDTSNLNKININIIPINNLLYKNPKTKEINLNLNKTKSKNKSLFSKNIPTLNTKSAKTGLNNIISKSKINEKLKSQDFKNLNDQEINTLEYNKALILDKRTYFQYYWSLLKKKQLILFTILPVNDYNLISLKIALLLLSFSLYFTINGFFFSDETMHKIHKENGAFNILVQIPQILYSSIVSSSINMLLKLLSLSEKTIIALKQEKDLKLARKKI